MKTLFIILLVLFLSMNLFSEMIWAEGFSGYANHTGLINIGGVATNTGEYPVSKWTLDTSGAPNFDVFYTDSIIGIGDVLRAKETGGVGDEVVFTSEVIDISDYYMVHCTVIYGVSETENTVSDEDYVKAFYKLDGGAIQPFSNANGVINGQVDEYNNHAEQLNLCGSTIQIIVKISADANTDMYDINRVTVTGASTTPSNHVTDLSGHEILAADQIQIDCTDSEVADTPADGYIVKASTGAIADPVNGVAPALDDDLTDGEGVAVMVSGFEVSEYVAYFNAYTGSTTYHFKVFPFTNSSCHGYIYKTDGAVPTCDVTSNPDPVAPGVIDLIINEIHPDDPTMATPTNGYIELYNRRIWEIDLSNVEVRYYDNGSAVPTATLNLFGKVMPHEYIVICQDFSTFTMSYPEVLPDFEAPKDGGGNTLFPLDGGLDTVELYLDAKSGTVDTFNDPSSPWAWDNTKDYERESTSDGGEETSWNDAGDGVPGGDDDPLPTTLASFTAENLNGSAILMWQTSSEINNMGWNVYRASTDNFAIASKLNSNLIEGQGSSTSTTNYQFNDTNLSSFAEQTIWYWLESISYSGETSLYAPISLFVEDNDEPNIPDIPSKYGLYANYPNPFNPETTISFNLDIATRGKLVIYNLKGERIKTLFSGEIMPNKLYKFTWNGADSFNKKVPSGIYFFKLDTENIKQIRKAILMK